MKKSLVLLCITTFSYLCEAAPRLWVIGKSYIALQSGDTVHYWKEYTPTSFGFDPERCALWIVDKNHLLQFTDTNSLPYGREETGAILSNVEASIFFTSRGKTLEKRGTDGKVLKTFEVADLPTIVSLHLKEDRTQYISLNLSGKELSFKLRNQELEPIRSTVVSENAELWNTQKLVYDPDNNRLWIGYSASTVSTVYAPILKAFTSEGSQIFEKTYTQKGLFGDLCQARDHSLYYSYEFSSNTGFTLPISSFLDIYVGSGNSNTSYAAEPNRFIDAIDCRTDRIYMQERSIFGSETSRIISLQRSSSSRPEKLLELEEPAQQIFSCY